MAKITTAQPDDASELSTALAAFIGVMDEQAEQVNRLAEAYAETAGTMEEMAQQFEECA